MCTSTAGAPLLLPRHPRARQGPLLDAPAWSPLHPAMSRAILRFPLVLFSFHRSPTPMAWRPMEKQDTGSLDSPCILRLCLHYRGPAVMLWQILTGDKPWKMNMLPFGTITLGTSFPDLPRLMWSLENGFSNTSSMPMAPWRGTRPVGSFGGSLNALVWIMTNPSARLSNQPLFAPSLLWHTPGIGRSINSMSRTLSSTERYQRQYIALSLPGSLILLFRIMSADLTNPSTA